MNRLTKVFFIFTAFLLTASLYAQKTDYSKLPGYVDFGNLSSLAPDGSGTEVNLDENMLKMASGMMQTDNPDISTLVAGLKLVKVNEFRITKDNKEIIEAKISDVCKLLDSENWSRMVKSKEKKEEAYVYIKTSEDGKICGLTVIAYNQGSDVAFVNIVGDINLKSIGSLTKDLNIPGLNNVKQKK